jgi:hypothetical protein
MENGSSPRIIALSAKPSANAKPPSLIAPKAKKSPSVARPLLHDRRGNSGRLWRRRRQLTPHLDGTWERSSRALYQYSISTIFKSLTQPIRIPHPRHPRNPRFVPPVQSESFRVCLTWLGSGDLADPVKKARNPNFESRRNAGEGAAGLSNKFE